MSTGVRGGSVCVATLYRDSEPPSGAAFDAWTNLLTCRPVDVVEVVCVSGSVIADNRNAIVRRFLASEAEWLFSVDRDMVFSLDVPRALLAHADAVERPIVGALCFKVHRSGELEPTLYRLARCDCARQEGEHSHLRTVEEWERGALVRVDATGAACMVVHRRVFETLEEPWFEAGELSGERLGEDVTFMLSARAAGVPIHVASSVDVGHVKPHAFGLADFERQQRERALVPTFAVIPVRNAGDPVPVLSLGGGVAGVIAIPNETAECCSEDGPLATSRSHRDPGSPAKCVMPPNIPRKWNEGLAWAEREARAESFDKWNVLFLNDDVELDVADVVAKLGRALRADPLNAVAYPNCHGLEGSGVVQTQTSEMAGQTLAGWCFMVRGESAAPFDERFVWWYGDSAYEKRINADGGKVVCVLDCFVRHLRPNVATFSDPDLLRQATADEALFAEKFGVDPKSLFLAQHPELVETGT